MSATAAAPNGHRLADRLRADLADFSIARVLRCLIDEDREPDGREGEVSRDFRDRLGRIPGTFAGRAAEFGPSAYVPLLAPVRTRPEARDLTRTTGAGGLHSPTDFTRVIDALRSKSLVLSHGATLIDTMSGEAYHLPKITAGSAAYWISESNAPVESAPTIGQVSFDPHTMGAFVDITRTLMSTSGGNAERIITADLFRALGTEMDRAALNGSGAGAEPEGLLPNSAVPAISLGVNGGAMTRAAAIAAELAIAEASADNGSLAWIASPRTRAAMRKSELSAGSGRYLFSDEDRVLSYPADATEAMPDNLAKGTGTDLGSLILGRWPSLVIGTWGAISITVDRYTHGTSGGVRIIAFLDVDTKPRNPEAFVRFVDCVTT